MLEIQVMVRNADLSAGPVDDTLAFAFDGNGTGYELSMTSEGRFVLYTLSGTSDEWETVEENYSGFTDEYGTEVTVENIARYMVNLFQ